MSSVFVHKMKDNPSTRQNWVDYLKVIAIIFIIITHDPWSVENSKLFVYSLIVDMAVPIFMIISGYNYTYSCRKKNIAKIADVYNIAQLKERLLRIVIPFIIMYFGEVCLLFVLKQEEYTMNRLLRDMLMGGYGPGAYYTPIMLQAILVMPLLYWFLKKYRIVALYIVFLVNLFFEIAWTFFAINDGLYSRCIIRYVFLIALGIYWCEFGEGSIRRKTLYICFVAGLIYIIGTQYIWEPVIFKRWTTTSMMVGFYLLPILLIFCMVTRKLKINGRVGNVIILCSNATFHIYLFQMLYYYAGVQRIFGEVSIVLRIMGSTIVCISGGCIFYYIMNCLKVKRGNRRYE